MVDFWRYWWLAAVQAFWDSAKLLGWRQSPSQLFVRAIVVVLAILIFHSLRDNPAAFAQIDKNVFYFTAAILVAVILFFMNLALAPHRLAREASAEISRHEARIAALEARLAPVIEVVADKHCGTCLWDYMNDPGTEEERYLRVGLRNPSVESVHDVSVKLVSLEGIPHELQLPGRLRTTHDHSDTGEPLTLHPSGQDHTVHIDVFVHMFYQNIPVQVQLLPRTLHHRNRTVPLGFYVGKLTAEGRGVSPTTAWFTLEFPLKDSRRRARLTLTTEEEARKRLATEVSGVTRSC